MNDYRKIIISKFTVFIKHVKTILYFLTRDIAIKIKVYKNRSNSYQKYFLHKLINLIGHLLLTIYSIYSFK